MIDKTLFDEKIEQLISMYEYDVYLIHPDTKINCICQDFTTQQGDPYCMKCLGTGKKIYIRKIPMAVQPCVAATNEFQNEITGRYYYARHDFHVQKYDIIVDRHHVDVVQQVRRYQSDHYKPVYYQISTRAKGANRELFYTNFYKLILGRDPYA